jgi:hypothetical protein
MRQYGINQELTQMISEMLEQLPKEKRLAIEQAFDQGMPPKGKFDSGWKYLLDQAVDEYLKT